MEYENILHSIGEFGKFQKTQVFFIVFSLIPYSWFSFCNTFYSVSPAHYCRVYDNQIFEKNSTLKICTIPYGTDNNGKAWDSCARYDVKVPEMTISNGSVDDCSYGKRTVDCNNGWVYDRSTFTNTQIMEFDLVCENDWLKQLSKTTYGIGVMCGTLLYGQLSDMIIKESARWLIQKERTEEAGKVIQEIAHWNNKTYDYELDMPHTSEAGKECENTTKREVENANTEKIGEANGLTALDLFRSPELRINTFNMCFYTFSVGIMYGGMSFNSNYFSGKVYTLYMLSCLVGIPANLLALWLFNCMPRRWLLCTTMTLNGALWISSAFIDNGVLRIVIITLAKICTTIALSVACAVCIEIYPTTLRSRLDEKSNEKRSLLNDSQ
ncbi:organic cation/carnitine transporter 2-like [Glandiceps talaboti]